MQLQNCPTRETLQNYLNGKLDDESSRVLDQHLEACALCEQTATNLECDPDTIIEILGKHPPIEESHMPEDFRDALQGLQAIRKIDVETKSEVISKIGGYAILSRLGRGGMGNVYLAQHQQLGKQVALKVLPTLLANNSDALARFQREMRAVGKLDHPTIVRATDAGQSDGHHFLVMERVDGLDVSQIARYCGPLSAADAAEIARQAALGLSYAHAQGVVHRDIKPSNLMLGTDGNIKILDFGLAQISLWEEGAAEITTVGQLMGTLDYMAPEQAERQGAVDYRADLYSLGATLFRLLTGRAPLAASPHLTPLEKLRLLNEFSPPKIQTLRNDLPESLCKIVADLLEHTPGKRPASAAHVAERLAPLAKGANLRSLLTQAHTKKDQADESDQEAAQIAPASSQPAHKAKTQSTFSRIGRGAIAIAACMLPLSIIAGIMFVIETQKGQLVIQSENANLKVKLVSDQEQTQTVQIVPGAQSTRLKAGKYEIELETPSDSFSLDKNEFTIKNGDTIVATISDRSVATMQTIAPKEPPTLSELVYDEKNADAWLNTLQYEGNYAKRHNASDALRQIVKPQNQSLILDRVTEILRSNPSREAFSLLPKVAGDNYFAVLADLLKNADDKSKIDLIGWSSFSPEEISSQALDHIDPFLLWADAALPNRASNDVLLKKTADYLLELAFGKTTTPAAQTKIVEHADRWPNFTPENFWLNYVSVPSDKPWPAPVCKIVLSRIKSVLADPTSDKVLIAKAIFTAKYVAEKSDPSQVAALIKDLSPLFRSKISAAAQNIKTATEQIEIQVPREHGQPIIFTICPTAQILELIRLTDTASLFKTELTSLHDSIPTTELKDYAVDMARSLRYVDYARFVDQVRKIQDNNSHTKRRATVLNLFLQSGRLVGKSEEELQSAICPPDQPAGSIWVGDVLAIYISGITQPHQERPILLQAGNRTPVVGSPFEVMADGNINVPSLGKINVAGKTPDQVKDAIFQHPDHPMAEVNFLMHSNDRKEIRQITGPRADTSALPAPSGNDAQLGSDATSQPNPALSESVYEGKNLETWLRTLQYEGKSSERSKASMAIEKIANRQNEAIVRKRILEILQSYPSQEAFGILPRITRGDYFSVLTDLLKNADAESQVDFVNWSTFDKKSVTPKAYDQIETFLSWIDSELRKHDANIPLSRAYLRYLSELLFDTNTSPSSQAKILEYAKKWPNLTDEKFWLSNVSELSNKTWTTPLYTELIDRSMVVIGDEKSSADLLARAVVILNHITAQDTPLVASAIKDNPRHINSRLAISSSNIDEALNATSLIVWENGYNTTKYVNPTLYILGVVQATKQKILFKEQLLTLHDAVPLNQIKELLIHFSAENRFHTQKDLEAFYQRQKAQNVVLINLIYVDEIYRISGEMLGISSEQMKSKIYPPFVSGDKIRSGDVLAIFVDGVSPFQHPDEPHKTIILQAGNNAPVKGLPYTVDDSGNINVPLIGDLQVAGMTLAEAKRVMLDAYLKAQILEGDPSSMSEVAFLTYAGKPLEIRQILGPAIELPRN